MSEIEELTDIIGNQIENLMALFLKSVGGIERRWGVHNGLEVAGEGYRYQLMVAKQGSPEYQQMKRQAKEMEEMANEQA